MSGAPKLRSTNIEDSQSRRVLVPAGNKTKLAATARKPLSKPAPKADGVLNGVILRERMSPAPAAGPKTLAASLSAPTVLKRQEVLLRSNFSMNASCSSNCSTESFRSRASTGRIGSRPGLTSRRRQGLPNPGRQSASTPEGQRLPRVVRLIPKIEKVTPDELRFLSLEDFQGKRRCPWVTPNTEPSYLAFHDEEWGVPVHDDKKLFELLVLSGALAELTWPVILNKRHIFREVFMDFDPVAVAKLSEKKITMQGSIARTLLSEPKLRAIIENACQILRIIEEFGSFDKYCWSFVSFKPVVNNFRYPRQVPVKTPKADVISKDLVRRGLRCVCPTVIYSFMQAAGITNDHLISCYRFEECCASAQASASVDEIRDQTHAINHKVEDNPFTLPTNANPTSRAGNEDVSIDFELKANVDDSSIS